MKYRVWVKFFDESIKPMSQEFDDEIEAYVFKNAINLKMIGVAYGEVEEILIDSGLEDLIEVCE